MVETTRDICIVLVAGMVIWGLWRATQPKRVFMVRIVGGAAEVVHGTVTPAFLERVREIARANQIPRGWVSGFSYGKLIRLRFSSQITKAGRQQMRNWWASYGWKAAGKTSTRRCS